MNSSVQRATGQITTFYSFKGGVGRTMALANVAFLAAMNGLRVLVMDWDLEAPGLAYYFRGLPSPDEARAIKTAPGVLNLVWDWRQALTRAAREADVDRLLQDYDEGVPFSRCVRAVLNQDRLPEGAALHLLGAGSKQIEDDLSYAEALARISWPEFFDTYAGGLFIERLRQWSRCNYDIILVDSRTGYADVAGVCTVQLPDVVALTFIYNRQNIEGVASVASSIVSQRGGEVKLRAVPMRISREGTPDEVDARSRAIRYLQRSGAFTEEAAKSDIERLAVRAAPGIPFYETLAQFATVTPTADQLTLDYKRLADVICEKPLDAVEVAADWREQVRRRLEPKTATADYLKELESADPTRAVNEVDRLLDGAFEAELHEDGLDRDYVSALIDFALNLNYIAFEAVGAERLRKIADKALSLARTEFEFDPQGWAEEYVDALEIYDGFEVLSDEARARRLLEYDSILAQGAWTAPAALRRAGIRLELAALIRSQNPEGALERLAEADALLDGIDALMEGPKEQSWVDTLVSERARIRLQTARSMVALNRTEDALSAGIQGLNLLSRSAGQDVQLSRTAVELRLLLAKLEADPEKAADHIVEAIDSDAFLFVVYTDLVSAAEILLRSNDGPRRALALIKRLAHGRQVTPRQGAPFVFGRSPSTATGLMKASNLLLEGVSPLEGSDVSEAKDALVRVNAVVIEVVQRRLHRRRDGARILTEATTLFQTAVEAGVRPEAIRDLVRAVGNLEAKFAGEGADGR